MNETSAGTAETRPEGITESEHQAIVTAVESILTERARAPEGLQAPERRRSGLGAVVLVNLLAFALLAGSVYLYITFVPRSAPDVNPFSGAVTTAESAILAEVQQQTRRELSEREVQIARIERELAALRRERQQAPEETGVSEREAELSAREAELSAALVDLQATTAERLQALQGNREQIAFLTDQLATVYERIRTAIGAQAYDRARAHLDDASSLLQSQAIADEPTLATVARAIAASNQVIADVIPLAAEETGRLAFLSSQFDEIERIVGEADARAAADEPERAASLYRTALGVMEATGHAATRLLQMQREESARELAQRTAPLEARVAELEAQLGESRRVAAELRGQIARLTADRDELARTGAELETDAAERLEAAAAAERRARALDREVAALESNVAALESDIATFESEIAALESRNAALRDERERATAEQAGQIAALRSSIEAVETDAEAAAAEIARGAARLRETIVEETGPSDAPEVIDLVGTRALLRAVVDSPAIREQYPTLYEDMEVYFQALSRERTGEGRADAYRAASEAIEALAAQLGTPLSIDSPAATAAGYLERLVSLLSSAVRLAVP